LIEPTSDLDLIKSILTDPDLYKAMNQDGSKDITEFKVVTKNVSYLLISEESPIGLIILHPDSRVSYRLHIAILPKHRKHSEKAGKDGLNWIFTNTSIRKINAEIPTVHQNVIKFTEKNGFTREGTRRKSYLKDGQIWDVALYGITREEWSNG